ncbi:MAG: PilZ domain-containing protein [Chloroflexi bacterium]|nr:PilZ domain-containing protein [Chloroflexota bacterium]
MRARQFQRIPSSIPAVVHLSFGTGTRTSRFGGHVRNVSVLGLFVLLEETFGTVATGARAQIQVERPGNQPRLDVSGVVVNSAVNPDNSHRIHIKFDRVHHEMIKDLGHHQRIIVELNPYGWTQYREQLVHAR